MHQGTLKQQAATLAVPVAAAQQLPCWTYARGAAHWNVECTLGNVTTILSTIFSRSKSSTRRKNGTISSCSNSGRNSSSSSGNCCVPHHLAPPLRTGVQGSWNLCSLHGAPPGNPSSYSSLTCFCSTKASWAACYGSREPKQTPRRPPPLPSHHTER